MFETNLNNNEHEISEVQFEEYALKLNASDFACRSKAEARPQRREFAGSATRSKKLIHFLRHGSFLEKTMVRLNPGESEAIFRNISCTVINGLTTSGRKALQEEEETRKDTSTVLIRQEQFCTSEFS